MRDVPDDWKVELAVVVAIWSLCAGVLFVNCGTERRRCFGTFDQDEVLECLHAITATENVLMPSRDADR